MNYLLVNIHQKGSVEQGPCLCEAAKALKDAGYGVLTLTVERNTPSLSMDLLEAIGPNGVGCVVTSCNQHLDLEAQAVCYETKYINPALSTVVLNLPESEPHILMEELQYADYGLVGFDVRSVVDLAHSIETGYGIVRIPGIVTRLGPLGWFVGPRREA